jgi:hypothetical protein
VNSSSLPCRRLPDPEDLISFLPSPGLTLLRFRARLPTHRPGKSPLVPGTSSQCSRSPHHQKGNGIHGPYERPLSATTLDTGFWQQSLAPFSRHLGHSRNRYMFLYQTNKHAERQKDHVRQNSLRLQITQKRKIMG